MIDDILKLFSNSAFAAFATLFITMIIQPFINYHLKMREKRASAISKIATQNTKERREVIIEAIRLFRQITKCLDIEYGMDTRGICKIINNYKSNDTSILMSIYAPEISDQIDKISAYCFMANLNGTYEDFDNSRELEDTIRAVGDQICATAKSEFNHFHIPPHNYSPANGS